MERFLVAPFEDPRENYSCHCQSCKTGGSYRRTVLYLFWIGFLCPIAYLANVMLYIYTQWITEHEPTHPQLKETDYPTAYEIEQKMKRSVIQVKQEVHEDTNELPSSSSDSDLSVMSDQTNILVNMDDERYTHLYTAATEVLEAHDSLRRYYRNWTLRSVLGLVIDITIILIITLTCRHSSNGRIITTSI